MTDRAAAIFNMRTVDHIGIVVKDARKVAAAWERMLGIGPWTFTETEGRNGEEEAVRVMLAFAYSDNGVEYELIQPISGRILHADYLDSTGGGLHHLANMVDDVDGEAARLVAAGAEIVLRSPGQWAYLRFEGDGGVTIELMRKHAPYTG